MQMNVGTFKTTFTTSDSEVMLHPAVLDRITSAVMERMERKLAQQNRAEEERRIRRSVSGEYPPAVCA